MIEQEKSLRELDKPFYRYPRAIYNSFFCSELYVDVGKRWKGFGFLYLLLLLSIVTIPFSIRIINESILFFEEQLIQPIRDLPILYVQNGQVSIKESMPYYVKNRHNQIVSIVDTTGAVTAIDQTYPDLSILITKDRMLYRLSSPQFYFTEKNTVNNTTKVYEFPLEDNTFIFDGKEWVKKRAVTQLKSVIAVLLYITMVLLAFGISLVFILTFALMGQFIAKLFFKLTINYKLACRLLIVSMTPFIVIFWIIFTLGYFSPAYSFFLPLIMIAYFCYAVLALKRESNKLVSS